jgi:hypothetical protein
MHMQGHALVVDVLASLTQACAGSGAVKVRWNACRALGTVFSCWADITPVVTVMSVGQTHTMVKVLNISHSKGEDLRATPFSSSLLPF